MKQTLLLLFIGGKPDDNGDFSGRIISLWKSCTRFCFSAWSRTKQHQIVALSTAWSLLYCALGPKSLHGFFFACVLSERSFPLFLWLSVYSMKFAHWCNELLYLSDIYPHSVYQLKCTIPCKFLSGLAHAFIFKGDMWLCFDVKVKLFHKGIYLSVH